MPFLDLLTAYGSPWGMQGADRRDAADRRCRRSADLVTEIPGPASRPRLERKRPHVADGVGTMLPVFVDGGGRRRPPSTSTATR